MSSETDKPLYYEYVKHPFGLYQKVQLKLSVFFSCLNLDSRIGVWWCDVLLTSRRNSYCKGFFEIEEYLISLFCLCSSSSFQVGGQFGGLFLF